MCFADWRTGVFGHTWQILNMSGKIPYKSVVHEATPPKKKLLCYPVISQCYIQKGREKPHYYFCPRKLFSPLLVSAPSRADSFEYVMFGKVYRIEGDDNSDAAARL